MRGKRVLVLWLAMLLAVGCIPMVYAGVPDVSDTVDAYEQINFVLALKLMDCDAKGDFRPDDFLTRAEFSKTILRIAHNCDTDLAPMETGIPGVSADEPNAAYIKYAADAGLLRLHADGSAAPSGEVTAELAAYGLVRAMEFQQEAEQKGGYPTGYLMTAMTKRLFKGVTANGALTRRDMAILAYNAVTGEYFRVVGIDEEGSVQYGKNSTTLLQTLFHIDVIKGVLKTARSEGRSGNIAYIDGKQYNSSIYLEPWLGQQVHLYYDTQAKTVVHLERKSLENLLLYFDEIESYEAGTLTYVINSRKYRVSIDENALCFRNGVETRLSERLFYPVEGYINLIDNGFGGYTTVISTEAETVVVRGVDAEYKKIYDMYDSGKVVDLLDAADTYTIVKNEKEATLKDLSKYDVLSVVYPENRKNITVTVCADALSGQLTETGEDFLKIDGKTYYTSKYFAQGHELLTLGNEYNVYFDMYGRVAAVELSKLTGSNYGYVIDAKKKAGLDGTVQLKLLTVENKMVILDFADKVTVDGVRAKSELEQGTPLGDALHTLYRYDAAVGIAAEQKNFVVRQAVKYKTNAEGKIISFDTAAKGEREGQDSLLLDTIIPDSTTLRYRSSPRQFGTKFGIDGSKTVIFSVPNSENDEIGRMELTDDNYAAVTVGEFKNDSYYGDMYVFDMSDGGVCDLLVRRSKASTKTGVKPDNSSQLMLVSRVSQVLSEVGDETYRVTGWMDGAMVSYDAEKPEFLMPYYAGTVEGIEHLRNKLIVPGDIIQIGLNTQGQISGIYYRFDRVNRKVMHESDIYADGSSSEDAYKGYYGKVVSKDAVGLRMTDGENGSIAAKDLNTFMAKSVSRIYIYDEALDKVYAGTWDDVTDYNTSIDNASHVYMRTRWGDPMQMVIYQLKEGN